jgi:hypothetical protein
MQNPTRKAVIFPVIITPELRSRLHQFLRLKLGLIRDRDFPITENDFDTIRCSIMHSNNITHRTVNDCDVMWCECCCVLMMMTLCQMSPSLCLNIQLSVVFKLVRVTTPKPCTRNKSACRFQVSQSRVQSHPKTMYHETAPYYLNHHKIITCSSKLQHYSLMNIQLPMGCVCRCAVLLLTSPLRVNIPR